MSSFNGISISASPLRCRGRVISAKLPLCAPDRRFQKVNLPAEDLIETTISKTSPEEDNKDGRRVPDL